MSKLQFEFPASTQDDVRRRLDFLVEADKLKGVQRRALLMDGSRFENSAEHSWHVALAAWLLADYAPEGADISHVMRMLLAHDIVEIDAGDTFSYDFEGRKDQFAREEAAAARLFGLLPSGQAQELRALWVEFDEGRSPEARYANAIDRLLPLLHNYVAAGGSWLSHGVTRAQVLARMASIEHGAPALWPTTLALIDDAVDKGYLLP